MKTIHVKDLNRSDELTIEEMKAATGGFTALRPADATYEFPSGADETSGVASSLSFIRSTTATVIKSLGAALETVARKA